MKRYSLVLIFLFIACKEKQKRDSEISQSRQDSCFGKVDRINIAREILKTKNIQTYLHLDLKERNPVKILKNDFFIGIDSFILRPNHFVKIVDSVPKGILNLRLELLYKDTCRFEVAKYVFFSPIENAEVNGNVTLLDSGYLVTVNQDIEF